MVKGLKHLNQLTVINALECCEGLFTRTRNRQGKVENSIIDFFVVCKRVLPHATQMIVDDKKQFSITNYKGAKYGEKKKLWTVTSDVINNKPEYHNTKTTKGAVV